MSAVAAGTVAASPPPPTDTDRAGDGRERTRSREDDVDDERAPRALPCARASGAGAAPLLALGASAEPGGTLQAPSMIHCGALAAEQRAAGAASAQLGGGARAPRPRHRRQRRRSARAAAASRSARAAAGCRSRGLEPSLPSFLPVQQELPRRCARSDSSSAAPRSAALRSAVHSFDAENRERLWQAAANGNAAAVLHVLGALQPALVAPRRACAGARTCVPALQAAVADDPEATDEEDDDDAAALSPRTLNPCRPEPCREAAEEEDNLADNGGVEMGYAAVRPEGGIGRHADADGDNEEDAARKYDDLSEYYGLTEAEYRAAQGGLDDDDDEPQLKRRRRAARERKPHQRASPCVLRQAHAQGRAKTCRTADSKRRARRQADLLGLWLERDSTLDDP